MCGERRDSEIKLAQRVLSRFQNRFGTLPNPASVNRTIKRIVNSYNADERLNVAREGREPMLLPEFSCHHLRHTFATWLCEVENNLKVIQSITGHKNIETTRDVYAEVTDRKKEETFENLAAKLLREDPKGT